jgi:hypothetical protein
VEHIAQVRDKEGDFQWLGWLFSAGCSPATTVGAAFGAQEDKTRLMRISTDRRANTFFFILRLLPEFVTSIWFLGSFAYL